MYIMGYFVSMPVIVIGLLVALILWALLIVGH